MRNVVKLLVCLMVLTFWAGPGFSADTIKIGLMAPLTGFAAADGLSVLNSVKLAVESVNKDGGINGSQVELVISDDRADSKEAIILARKLIQRDRVVAVVGGSYSSPSRVSAPIFNEAGVPMVVAYAVHPDITKAGKFVFRNGFLAKVEAQAVGSVAVDMLGAKKIAMLTMDNDFGRTVIDGMQLFLSRRGKGAEVILSQVYPFKENDFKAYLAKIKDINPEIIVATGYYFQTGPILKQAQEMGIKTQIIGEEGADSPKLFEIAGTAAEGFILTTNLDRDDKRSFVQDYLKEYQQRYNIQADMVGASAFDAFMILANGIAKAKSTDGEKIRQIIARTKDYDGLTGVIKGFTEDREVIKNVQVQIVKDGKFRHYNQVSDIDIITPK